MELVSFRSHSKRAISQHGSRGFTIAPLVRSEQVSVACVRLTPGGVIGRHAAACLQVLAIVEGSAMVSGGDEAEHHLTAGDAAIWQAGEFHQTRSHDGMVAIVIETTG